MSDEAIHNDRQKVYGDWRPNMAGTSLQIDGLRVQYEANNPGSPLPAWWAPLCLVATKLNRIASGNYHEDNFVDLRVYLGFVEQMQGGKPAYTPPNVTLPDGWEWAGECREVRDGDSFCAASPASPDRISIGHDARAELLRVGMGEDMDYDGPRHIVRRKGGDS